MTAKKKYILIILSSTFFALVAGAAGSFYWIKNVYLKEQMQLKINAVKLTEWYQSDPFVTPGDNKISDSQMRSFIKVNHDMSYLLERMQQQFQESSWSIAIDVIKMQPEWLASKYTALREHGLSPMEYDWIADQVLRFWVHQWKQESLQILKEYGWSLDTANRNKDSIMANYELFMKYDHELNKIFDLLWPGPDTQNLLKPDSLVSSSEN